MPLISNEDYAKQVGLPVEDLEEVFAEMQEFADYQDGKIQWSDLKNHHKEKSNGK